MSVFARSSTLALTSIISALASSASLIVSVPALAHGADLPPSVSTEVRAIFDANDHCLDEASEQLDEKAGEKDKLACFATLEQQCAKLAIESDRSVCFFGLAEIEGKEGLYSDAIRALTRHLKYEPDNIEAVGLIGWYRYSIENDEITQGARKTYSSALYDTYQNYLAPNRDALDYHVMAMSDYMTYIAKSQPSRADLATRQRYFRYANQSFAEAIRIFATFVPGKDAGAVQSEASYRGTFCTFEATRRSVGEALGLKDETARRYFGLIQADEPRDAQGRLIDHVCAKITRGELSGQPLAQ